MKPLFEPRPTIRHAVLPSDTTAQVDRAVLSITLVRNQPPCRYLIMKWRPIQQTLLAQDAGNRRKSVIGWLLDVAAAQCKGAFASTRA